MTVDIVFASHSGDAVGFVFHTAGLRLSGELGARIVIPMHYGVMPHNPIEPRLFLDSLRAQGSASTPHVLEIGETVLLS